MPPSDALSILKNSGQTIEGRKLGILVADGSDAKLLQALTAALVKENAGYEIIAPKIAGAKLSDGTMVEAKQKIDGGPSVLYDAVAVLLSEAGAKKLSTDAPSKDFVSDAFAHCKMIAYTPETSVLFKKAGIADDLDGGCFEVADAKSITAFLDACKTGRFWEREMMVDLDSAILNG